MNELGYLASGDDYDLAVEEIQAMVRAAWRRLEAEHPFFADATNSLR